MFGFSMFAIQCFAALTIGMLLLAVVAVVMAIKDRGSVIR